MAAAVEAEGDLLLAVAGEQALERLDHARGQTFDRQGLDVAVPAAVRWGRRVWRAGCVAVPVPAPVLVPERRTSGVEHLAQVGDEPALLGDRVAAAGVLRPHDPRRGGQVTDSDSTGGPGHHKTGRRPAPPV